mgnify:CR=1 FL=1|tara:strand:+ start:29 stop:556 length:528 start_codon:yes stop_codon:yes gene_type:complete
MKAIKKADNGAYTDPVKKKKKTFKNLSDREIKISKNKEFNDYAVKKGIIPNFSEIEDIKERTNKMEEFYGNKKNVSMLNKEQSKYFESKKIKKAKNGGSMKKIKVVKKAKAGAKLKMVKGPDGKMVPFYANDGKGKMEYGGALKKMKAMYGSKVKMAKHGSKVKMAGKGAYMKGK